MNLKTRVMAAENTVLEYKIDVSNCNNILQYCCFYCIFDQINAALVSIRGVFRKHYKKCTDPKLLTLL